MSLGLAVATGEPASLLREVTSGTFAGFPAVSWRHPQWVPMGCHGPKWGQMGPNGEGMFSHSSVGHRTQLRNMGRRPLIPCA